MTPARALLPQTETEPQIVGNLTALSSRGQSPAGIIRQIEALWWNRNVDGYSFKPEPHASHTAKSYIRAVYPFVDPNLPLPEVDSDGLGGIEIQWRHGDRTVILACRPNRSQRDFIYCKHGRHVVIGASPLNLKERLKWLIS